MKTTSLRILHTSDWHIGRTLYGRRRYETFSAFLDWLADTVRDRHVDVLINWSHAVGVWISYGTAVDLTADFGKRL